MLGIALSNGLFAALPLATEALYDIDETARIQRASPVGPSNPAGGANVGWQREIDGSALAPMAGVQVTHALDKSAVGFITASLFAFPVMLRCSDLVCQQGQRILFTLKLALES